MQDSSPTEKFMNKAISTFTVEKWVQAVVCGQVVLPMIQRGSVWRPHQILDLWDTLLQGMPLGAMMMMPIKAGTPVFKVITRNIKPADAGAIALLDGQQRTLAMLSVWPGIENQLQRRVAIWVDLADEPPGEYLFRLWAATRAQPFGYERIGVGGQALSKLSAADRRAANAVYNPDGQGSDDMVPLWDTDAFMPWRATFPIRLSRLIQDPHYLDDIDTRLREKEQALERLLEARQDQECAPEIVKRLAKLKQLCTNGMEKLKSRAQQMQDALARMRSLSFPLIPVGGYLDAAANGDYDPPIAVLFKRVAVGGQSLSNEDYIFSVLKHYEPEVHTLVEGLLDQKSIAATYTANDLVMTAVRVHLQQLQAKTQDGKTQQNFRDEARIQKARFSRLAQDKDFSSAFKSLIGSGGRFQETLERLLSVIAYAPEFTQGLPQHALPWLVDRFLFDVLLAWFTNSENDPASSKLSLVRFLLWGFLSIPDKAKASELCISELERLRQVHTSFPERQLMSALIDKRLAFTFPAPESIRPIAFTPPSAEGAVLRGQSRFYQNGEPISDGAEVYRRWWNIRGNRHEHPFLLWLQRDFIYQEFESQPALAGTEEETPYDFDHILPQSHWAWWTGCTSNRLIDFAKQSSSDHGFLGNAIGNLRVWPARLNREDGDASPVAKLGLGDTQGRGPDASRMLQSRIEGDAQLMAWIKASGEGQFVDRAWDRERAIAFQEAIELRTFTLYDSFYRDLHFADLQADVNPSRSL
ncbi:MAG: DUF262 domain-containing protein [Acidithiobacillus sp.]|jgi:hypothetical protein|uniref:DUF262 domain-containing protein n=1 Tax=Acidithiobacillus sp. TaxID=1872118 RepID=UPI00355EC1AD